MLADGQSFSNPSPIPAIQLSAIEAVAKAPRAYRNGPTKCPLCGDSVVAVNAVGCCQDDEITFIDGDGIHRINGMPDQESGYTVFVLCSCSAGCNFSQTFRSGAGLLFTHLSVEGT